MLKVSQLLSGRPKSEPGQLEEAERGLHPGTEEEQEVPAKGEGVGGRKPHARCWHLAYVTFVNIYETKGDQVQMGRKQGRKPDKGADVYKQGVSPAECCRKAKNNGGPKAIRFRDWSLLRERFLPCT